MANDEEKKKQLESLKKRSYGLAKKSEQLRRAAGVKIALFIFDEDSKEHFVYLSKDEHDWPPSMAEIRSAPTSEILLLEDWTTESKDEEIKTPLRKTIPDIRLRPSRLQKRKRRYIQRQEQGDSDRELTPCKPQRPARQSPWRVKSGRSLIECSNKSKRMMEKIKHAGKPTALVLPPPPEPPHLLVQLAKKPQFSFTLPNNHKQESSYEEKLRALGRDYFVVPPLPVFRKKLAENGP